MESSFSENFQKKHYKISDSGEAFLSKKLLSRIKTSLTKENLPRCCLFRAVLRGFFFRKIFLQNTSH